MRGNDIMQIIIKILKSLFHKTKKISVMIIFIFFMRGFLSDQSIDKKKNVEANREKFSQTR